MRTQRMRPLCTWQGRLWGPHLRVQKESREEEERDQRQRKEAGGGETPQRQGSEW